ncbi:hypothetical protein P5673_006268 [Acropora cervicornis]|uniref:Uncharacterized protein n=1 Tax=Acropora cervicornis TaxID=6130 RepID=A0AAD9QXR3_ACRCE|nr:hypothetical protein P5673_006268 [Acropora cervicornis]
MSPIVVNTVQLLINIVRQKGCYSSEVVTTTISFHKHHNASSCSHAMTKPLKTIDEVGAD